MNVNWLFNKCRRQRTNISLLANGGLNEEERAEVEAHLAECPGCRARFEGLKSVVGHFERLAHSLPEVTPGPGLRRRWMSAVKAGSRADRFPASSPLNVWLTGRRVAWGSLAAVWTLILFFRLTAPEAPKPAVVTAAPSFRELLAVLKAERQQASPRTDEGTPVPEQRLNPGVKPPRSERRHDGEMLKEAT
jgi:anti-sigma factor RsiW